MEFIIGFVVGVGSGFIFYPILKILLVKLKKSAE